MSIIAFPYSAISSSAPSEPICFAIFCKNSAALPEGVFKSLFKPPKDIFSVAASTAPDNVLSAMFSPSGTPFLAFSSAFCPAADSAISAREAASLFFVRSLAVRLCPIERAVSVKNLPTPPIFSVSASRLLLCISANALIAEFVSILSFPPVTAFFAA